MSNNIFCECVCSVFTDFIRYCSMSNNIFVNVFVQYLLTSFVIVPCQTTFFVNMFVQYFLALEKCKQCFGLILVFLVPEIA